MGRLGQLLVARGWITVQQLTRALQNQSAVGGRLGTCLVEMDAISEENLLKGLSEQLGVPAASLDDLRGIPEEVLSLIPEKLARRCRAIPFRSVGSRLDVALMEPRNLSSQDELAFASGRRISVHVAHELRILEALERYYGDEVPSRLRLLVERLNRARYFWSRDKPEEAERRPGDELTALPPLPAPPPAPARRARTGPDARPAAAPAPPAAPPPAKPAEAPARPAKAAPKPMQTVALTAEERAELKRRPAAADEPAPGAALPPPPPSLPAPASVDEAETAFSRTHDREEVARIALGFLAQAYKRVAIFQVARERVSAWMAQGEMDLPVFLKYSVGLDQPSLFLNLRQGSGLHIGALPPMPAHREMARAWGGELPKDCVVLPVRINDRLVAVLYADGGLRSGKGIGGIELSQLQRLAASTGAALERCILHRKRAEAGP